MKRLCCFGISSITLTLVIAASQVFAAALPAPPSGYAVAWFFPGARTATGNGVGMCVHCSNFSTTSTDIKVQFFDRTGGVPVGSQDFTLFSGWTKTVAADNDGGGPLLYFEDGNVNLTSDLAEGVVRVLVKSANRKIICSAQILDFDHNPPNYIESLQPFDDVGHN